MQTPIIIVNFKAYKQAIGENGVKLAQICEMVAKKRGVEIAVAVQAADINRVAYTVNIPVLAEHIDPADYGSHTGSVIAEGVKENGAVGTLLNHSEKQLEMDVLEKSIAKAKKLGLITVVCANTPEKAEEAAKFNPDYVAVEPPELIGGTVSVSKAKPEVITETVERVKKVNPKIKILTGAGVHTKNDVQKALELGTAGVLLASGVTKAEDPGKVLNELCDGIK